MFCTVDLILLIGVFYKEELFCSSDDFLESFVNETAFCTFSGKYTIKINEKTETRNARRVVLLSGSSM